MPTGYTYPIIKEENYSLKQFIIQCSRAMGACIMQRDDSFDDPPKMDEVSSYYQESVTKALAELEEWLELPKDVQVSRVIRNLEERVASAASYLKDKLEAKVKLQAMEIEVIKWEPPTPDHQGLKDFMLQQLRLSLDHDGSVDYAEQRLKKAKADLADTDHIELAVKLQESRLREDLDYNQKHYAEEVERVNGRNKWKQELLDAVAQLAD